MAALHWSVLFFHWILFQLTAPPLHVTIVHPQIEVRTSDARSILKHQVQLKDAIRQWGNIAGLVAGLLKNDYELIGRSLEDVLIEPVRSILIPGFDEIKRKSKEAGASAAAFRDQALPCLC
jgi:homoserine kinase